MLTGARATAVASGWGGAQSELRAHTRISGDPQIP